MEKMGEVFEWVGRNRVMSVVMGVGLILMIGGGVWSMKTRTPMEVEVISAESKVDVQEASESASVWVDVQGAVVAPGVYELGSGARIKDALLAAGGMAVNADRGQVARYINLAAKVSDGVKIYIPVEGEVGQGLADEGSGMGSGEVLGVGMSGGKVNLNTASVSQLDALWGIGEARAKAIIEGRPYTRVEEIQEKKIVPTNVWERIKDEVGI